MSKHSHVSLSNDTGRKLDWPRSEDLIRWNNHTVH